MGVFLCRIANINHFGGAFLWKHTAPDFNIKYVSLRFKMNRIIWRKSERGRPNRPYKIVNRQRRAFQKGHLFLNGILLYLDISFKIMSPTNVLLSYDVPNLKKIHPPPKKKTKTEAVTKIGK